MLPAADLNTNTGNSQLSISTRRMFHSAWRRPHQVFLLDSCFLALELEETCTRLETIISLVLPERSQPPVSCCQLLSGRSLHSHVYCPDTHFSLHLRPVSSLHSKIIPRTVEIFPVSLNVYHHSKIFSVFRIFDPCKQKYFACRIKNILMYQNYQVESRYFLNTKIFPDRLSCLRLFTFGVSL